MAVRAFSDPFAAGILVFDTGVGIGHLLFTGGVARRFIDGTQPSLEAQLANLADEIAYNAHDIDDGVRSGLLTLTQVAEVPLFALEHMDGG